MTLNDIARAAGVSRTTASYVLSGNGPARGVAPATIAHVEATARALGYVPNLAARNLRQQRSGLIGVLLSGFQIGWAHQLEIGIQRALENAPGSILPVFAPHHGNAAKVEQRFMNLVQHQVDGLLIHAPMESCQPFFLEQTQRRVPLVFFTDTLTALENQADTVLFDGFEAAVAATRHLIHCGCRRLAAVHSDSQWLMQPRRFEGFSAVLHESGLTLHPDHDFQFRFSTRTEEELTTDMANWLDPILRDPATAPDGIFCEHDSVAVMILNLLCRAGRTRPEHTPRIVSIGNLPIRDECGRGITSMTEPVSEIGELAVKILLQRVEDRTAPFQQAVIRTSRLIQRESA